MLSNIRIVLVQTFHPGNIGSAARAMKTMGLDQLALVNPRSFPDQEATRLAAGASDLLEQARVHETLEEAVKDCIQVIGASARLRSLPLPHFDETDVMANDVLAHAGRGPVALVFGRERFGLTNDEIRCCTHQLSIPSSPDYPVLNLSQAVQVCAHELFTAWRRLSGHSPQRSEGPTPSAANLPPTREQTVAFQAHLARALEETGFLNQPHAQTLEKLNAFFQRAQPTRKELSLLHGMLSALEQHN